MDAIVNIEDCITESTPFTCTKCQLLKKYDAIQEKIIELDYDPNNCSAVDRLPEISNEYIDDVVSKCNMATSAQKNHKEIFIELIEILDTINACMDRSSYIRKKQMAIISRLLEMRAAIFGTNMCDIRDEEIFNGDELENAAILFNDLMLDLKNMRKVHKYTTGGYFDLICSRKIAELTITQLGVLLKKNTTNDENVKLSKISSTIVKLHYDLRDGIANIGENTSLIKRLNASLGVILTAPTPK